MTPFHKQHAEMIAAEFNLNAKLLPKLERMLAAFEMALKDEWRRRIEADGEEAGPWEGDLPPQVRSFLRIVQ